MNMNDRGPCRFPALPLILQLCFSCPFSQLKVMTLHAHAHVYGTPNSRSITQCAYGCNSQIHHWTPLRDHSISGRNHIMPRTKKRQPSTFLISSLSLDLRCGKCNVSGRSTLTIQVRFIRCSRFIHFHSVVEPSVSSCIQSCPNLLKSFHST